MPKQSVTEQLRENLFDTLKGLKDGSISVETANAVSKISSNIISTVVVEIQAAEAIGSHRIDSINGIDHRVTNGGIVHRIKE